MLRRRTPPPRGKRDLLNGSGWQFVGYEDATKPPDIGTDAFNQAAWTAVEVPHNFQTRAAYNTLTRGWYRRQVTVDPSAQGKELYLVFEGAATLADVYVNGQHLGQHRGAYTRFVFDATKALHVGTDNQLAVLVNDSPADTTTACRGARPDSIKFGAVFTATSGWSRLLRCTLTRPISPPPAFT